MYGVSRAMKTADHLGPAKLLVVQVEEDSRMDFDRRPFCATSLDPAVLAHRHPSALQPISQPDFIIGLLRVIREVVCDAMNLPAKFAQAFSYATAETPVKKELRQQHAGRLDKSTRLVQE